MSESKENTIVLISCVKRKIDTTNGPVPAKNLYDSPLFKKSLQYAKEVLKVGEDRIFILSAKHYLLPLNQPILRYEQTLKNASAKERREWADIVWQQLSKRFSADTKYIILAGKNYLDNLIGSHRISNCQLPLDGMPMGKRLQALNKAIMNKTIL